MFSRSLIEVANYVQARLTGDNQVMVSRVQPFDIAGPGDIALASDVGYLTRLGESRASAFIIPERLPQGAELVDGLNYLVSSRPKLAFARAIELLHGQSRIPSGVDASAVIGSDTTLGKELSIYPGVVIGRGCSIGDRVSIYPGTVIGDNSRIGSDTTLYANVTVYDDCEIGRRVIIHGGTVIGADGFGFVPDEQGRQFKILQTGNVVIEDDVEIGANCCIDRATFGSTILRRGVKLDNLIQVAHNCALGEDTVVASQVGLSGSTTVGNHVVIAGQAATNQHVTINDNVVVGGQAGVTKSVAAGKFVAGTPAQDHNQWKRAQILVAKLPEIYERLKALEKQLEKSEISE
jgi:UDP-3-O-[3-hydroxymyristoyl] glucosamine N-acyltransferase